MEAPGMSAFAAAAAALFADDNMAEGVEWWPAGETLAGTEVRAVISTPTVTADAFGQTVARPSLVAWVPAQYAVAQGDRIKRGTAFHPVRDEPELDEQGTQKRLNLGPAASS
jgi:hypothetical protein